MFTRSPAQPSARKDGPPSPRSNLLMRKCAACSARQTDDEKRKSPLLQRKAQRPLSDEQVPAEVDMALRSGGAALPGELRQHFENSFGHDFSQVRIHTDSLATQSARAVGARAYTVGSDIVFNNSEFQPHSPAGRHLLAHELTHVVQQSAMPAQGGGLRVGAPDSGFEREADSIADRVANTPVIARSSARGFAGMPRATIGGISAAPAAVQRVGECAGRTFRAGNCTGTPCQTAANEPGTCRWVDIARGCVCFPQYRPGTPVPAPAPAPAPAPSSEDESSVRRRLPSWIVPLLGAAAMAAVIACFATGACEVGGLVLAAGAATAALLVGVLRAAGVNVTGGDSAGSEA